jgi:sortase A
MERVSFALGVVCLGAYSLDRGEAWFFTARQEERLVAASAAASARVPEDESVVAATPLRGIATAEESWGRIEVPRLALRAFLAEGVSKKALRVAVGHIPGTAFPDEVGNVGLAGHRDSVFRPLSGLVVGDIVTLVTPSARFDYRIETIQIVEPTRTDVLAPTEDKTLTLVTCYPFDVWGPAPLRMIARGRLARTDAGDPTLTPEGQRASDLGSRPSNIPSS